MQLIFYSHKLLATTINLDQLLYSLSEEIIKNCGSLDKSPGRITPFLKGDGRFAGLEKALLK